MRILLLLPLAAIAIAAMPADAQYLVNGCGSGDYTVAEVTLANREIAHVCTSSNPLGTIHIRCTPVTCR